MEISLAGRRDKERKNQSNEAARRIRWEARLHANARARRLWRPDRNEQKRRALAARPRSSSCRVMPTREQIWAMATEIRRQATVIALKRQALDPAPIPDGSHEQKFGGKFAIVTPNRRAPRAILVVPAKHARLLMTYMCLRTQ
jgi:hypothetical protein